MALFHSQTRRHMIKLFKKELSENYIYFSEIRARCHGYANVHWTERRKTKHGHHTVHYRATEDYFDYRLCVLGKGI